MEVQFIKFYGVLEKNSSPLHEFPSVVSCVYTIGGEIGRTFIGIYEKKSLEATIHCSQVEALRDTCTYIPKMMSLLS